MKRIIVLTLSLILTACTPQVTVTSEVTVTLPPLIETSIPTATISPQFQTIQKPLYEIAKVTKIEAEYNGVNVSIDLGVDKTALDVEIPSGGEKISLDNIILNESFVNKYGEDAKTALAHAVLYGQWRAWQENVDDSLLKQERKGVSFNKWIEMVKIAQETNLEEDWNKVIFQAYANDLTTEIYDPEYTDFKPGDNFKIVFTNEPAKNIGVNIKNVSYTGYGTGNENSKIVGFVLSAAQKIIYDQRGNASSGSIARFLTRLSIESQGSELSTTDFGDLIEYKGNDLLEIYSILGNGYNTDVAIIAETIKRP